MGKEYGTPVCMHIYMIECSDDRNQICTVLTIPDYGLHLSLKAMKGVKVTSTAVLYPYLLISYTLLRWQFKMKVTSAAVHLQNLERKMSTFHKKGRQGVIYFVGDTF